MCDFGHFHSSGAGCHLDSWGAGPFIIRMANGASLPFEDSDRFGPVILDQRGDPAQSQPEEKSLFWPAYEAWHAQGRQIAADGKTCVWRVPELGATAVFSPANSQTAPHTDHRCSDSYEPGSRR